MASFYLHPFVPSVHYIGFGDKQRWTLPAWVSLRGISPTLGRATYCYLAEMGNTSTTFSNCTDATDRIYVLGHGAKGSDTITTDPASQGVCTCADLAEIFENHGLPKTSHAHIRIHACESGLETEAEYSFAQTFLLQMMAHGYYNLTVRGYTLGVGPYIFKRLGTAAKNMSRNCIDFTIRPEGRPRAPVDI